MYIFLTFFLILFFIYFLVMMSPFGSIIFFWSNFSSNMTSLLGLSPLRPVGAFFAPFVFMTVFVLLVMGFLPYIVPVIVSLRFVFLISLFFWLVSFFYLISTRRFSLLISKNNTSFFMNLFLFWIEILGIFIRPFSLAIRLYANILFGHYLLFFLSCFLVKLGCWSFIFIFPFMVLELAVFIVQSYIFTYLVIMYFEE